MSGKRRLHLIFLVGVCLITGCDGAKTKVAELRSEINAQLPIGSSQTDVIAYLNKKHIEHTPYVDAGTDQEILRLNGAPGRVNGIIRNVSSGLFYRSDITLSFLFDKSGRLCSYDVSEAITSL